MNFLPLEILPSITYSSVVVVAISMKAADFSFDWSTPRGPITSLYRYTRVLELPSCSASRCVNDEWTKRSASLYLCALPWLIGQALADSGPRIIYHHRIALATKPYMNFSRSMQWRWIFWLTINCKEFERSRSKSYESYSTNYTNNKVLPL